VMAITARAANPGENRPVRCQRAAEQLTAERMGISATGASLGISDVARRCRSIMRNPFDDFGHLFRLAAVFLAGIVVFVAARSFLIPHSFGQYGHFRGDAIQEIAAKPVVFAGHQACESCHADILDVKSKGKHVRVTCESCHGALASHADDPGSVQPEKLDTAVLCVRCHEANNAKPQWFPQVVSAEHSNGLPCDTCHQPHSPALDSGVKTSEAKGSGSKNSGGKK
jgi:cytochrome c7-like protein